MPDISVWYEITCNIRLYRIKRMHKSQGSYAIWILSMQHLQLFCKCLRDTTSIAVAFDLLIYIPHALLRHFEKLKQECKNVLTMQTNAKAKQKYRGMFKAQKSGNKTSSGDIGPNIRTLASPKVGQDQVSRGLRVLCWHVASVTNVLWKPLAIR